MSSIISCIESFVNNLNLSGEVLGVSFDGTNSTLTLEDSYNARIGMTITINAVDYTLISGDAVNNQVVILGDLTALLGFTYTLQNPFFFHGTVYRTDSHLSNLKTTQKYPSVFLHEILRERTGVDLNYKEASIRLFLLDEKNPNDHTTDDTYNDRLTGLYKLAQKMQKEYDAIPRYISNDIEFEIVNYVDFGTFSEMKGNLKSYFSDYLCASELSFAFRVNKNCNC